MTWAGPAAGGRPVTSRQSPPMRAPPPAVAASPPPAPPALSSSSLSLPNLLGRLVGKEEKLITAPTLPALCGADNEGNRIK